MRIAVHGGCNKRHIIVRRSKEHSTTNDVIQSGIGEAYTVKDLKQRLAQEQRLKEDCFGLVYGGVDIIRDVDSETRIKALLARYQLNESVDLHLDIYQIDSIVIYLSDVKYNKRLCQKVKPHCTCKEIADLIFKLNLTPSRPTTDSEVFLFDNNGHVWRLDPLTSMETILNRIQGQESIKPTFFFTEDGHLRVWIENSLYLELISNPNTQ